MRIIILTLLAALTLSACVQSKQNVATMPVLTPPPTEEVDPMAGPNPGSLYDPGNADFLFSDNRARRVGDIVLVNIVENSSGKHEANTDSERETTSELGVDNFFNQSQVGLGMVTGVNPLGMTGNVGSLPILKVSSTSDFKGKGKTDRKGNVTATIGARVVKILPGGLMQIEGAREVKVNNETQIIVVRGLIRPRDIGSDNSILSSHMADARIEYYGKGVLADKQKPGWLARILDNIWPF